MRLLLLISLLATSIALSPAGFMAMGMMGSMLDDDDEWPMPQEPIKTNLRKEAVPKETCTPKASQATNENEGGTTVSVTIVTYFAVLIGMILMV